MTGRGAAQRDPADDHGLGWIDLALEIGEMAVWVWEAGAEQVRWHGDVAALHGLAPGAHVPTDLNGYLELIHPDDREGFAERFLASVGRPGGSELSYRVRADDGERWLRVRWTAVQEDGTLARLVGTVSDETSRREAEEQLARNALFNGFLADLSRSLSGTGDDLEALADTVARRVAAFLDATCVIRLPGATTEDVAELVMHGDHAGLFQEVRRRLDGAGSQARSGYVLEMVEGRRVLRLPDAEGRGLIDVVDPRFREIVAEFDAGPAIIVGLEAEGGTLGFLLVVRHRGQEAFEEHDADLLRDLARRVELAFRNAMLVRSLADELERRERVERSLETRAEQQSALVELSRRALEEPELADLLDLAVGTVVETLDVPMGVVLELSPSGDSFLVQAGRGWPEGFVGEARLGTSDTIAGLALQRGRPVAVTGSDHDPEPVQHLSAVARFGIQSGIAVLIPGPQGSFGALGVYDRRPRAFDDRDVAFLRAAGNVIGSAVERFRTQQRFLQSQRMEAVGRIAGGVAHDFNNLLTIIIGYAEMLRPQILGDEAVEDLDELRRAADQAAELVDNLLTFSRRDVDDRGDVLDVGAAIVRLEPMLRRVVYERIDLEVMGKDGPATTRIRPGELQQVLLNLVINAADAMPQGGRITIRVAPREVAPTSAPELGAAPGRYVAIEIEDTGTGMEREVLDRALDPFYTTKPAGQGTGLGLSTVYGIVSARGGAMHVDSQVGAGTTVRILLPHEDPATEQGRPRRRGPQIASSRADAPSEGMILLVEDDEAVRTLTARVLRERGYEVIVAGGGAEALALSDGVVQRLDLLVTDVVMPQMTGPELAAALRERRPDINTLYVSGYSEEDLPFEGVFVPKPYRIDQLVQTIGLLLEQRRRADGEG